MRPLSRGYVEAKSNRPGDAPAINPRYLSEESDRRAIIGGLRLARRMFAAPALQQFVREETLPGPQVQSDDELLDYAGVAVTVYLSAIPGGRIARARARRPPRRRRLGDAGTNTNAPSIIIAEKGAAMVKDAAAKTGGAALGAALPGRCQVIGKRRRRTRVRSATTMLRVISPSPMT
jgi:choline dehydrogenase